MVDIVQVARQIIALARGLEGILYSKVVREVEQEIVEDGKKWCLVAYSLVTSTGERRPMFGFILEGECKEVVGRIEPTSEERPREEPKLATSLDLPILGPEHIFAKLVVQLAGALLEKDQVEIFFECEDKGEEALLHMSYFKTGDKLEYFGTIRLPKVNCVQVYSSIIGSKFASLFLKKLEEKHPEMYKRLIEEFEKDKK